MPDSTGQNTNVGASSTIEDLNKQFNQFKSPKVKLEPDWYMNIAFYNGDQWIMWNNGRIDRPILGPDRIMLVDNRIMPVAFSRLAKKVKNRPTFVVTPNSYSEDDLNAAELGEKVLEDDWINLNLQPKLFEALMWAEVCSAGFWKIYWDKTKGDNSTEYVVGPDGLAILDAQQRPVQANSDQGQLALQLPGAESKIVAMGDMQVDVMSPFHLFPDPLAEELDDSEIIFEEHIRSVEYVRKHYGQDVQPDTDIPVGIAESRSFPFIPAPTGSTEYKGVTVKEMWGRPGSTNGGKGKRAAWTKNQVLEEGDLSNSPFCGTPYVMFPGIKVPGRFWPTCVTTQLRGPQTELNKMQSQVRESANRFGNPSLMTSTQGNVQYTGVPGERIFYDASMPESQPSFLQPPEMPVYVQNEIDRIEKSISEISGIHEVSKAIVPPGVTAASAINLLQEADETRLGPEIQDMELALGKAGEKILKLRAKFQSDERLIRSGGDDGDWNIAAYRGSMSKENTNVEVQAGSAMPKSKAAKQAAMTDLFQTMLQYGVQFNQRDIRKFLREYGVGGLDSMFAGLSADELQIRRENNLMKSGMAIQINDFDDDNLHIEGHEEMQKSKWYFTANPQEQQIISLHVQAHKDRRTQVMDAQVQEQQKAADAMNGGSGATNTQPQ